MASFEIVRYESDHHAAVLELQRRLWGEALALNERYFQWKYVDNPHAQFGDIFLAVADSRIVGMRGFMGTLWTDPAGAPVPIPLAGDTVVATDYEGRGIVNRLTKMARSEFAKRGIELILSTSASPVPLWLSLRSGWKTVGHYTRMRRRSRHYLISKLAQELRRIGVFPDRLASDPFAAQDGSDWPLDRETVMSLRNTADRGAFATLCAAAARSPKYSLLRDSAFFRWRFANPFFKYYFLTCWHDGALSAYLCLRVQERELGTDIRVVDWSSLEWRFFLRLLERLARRFPGVSFSMLDIAFTAAERRDLVQAGYRQVAHRGSRASRALKVKPAVLVIPTADDRGPAQALVEGGFDLLEFKGIESDGA